MRTLAMPKYDLDYGNCSDMINASLTAGWLRKRSGFGRIARKDRRRKGKLARN
jgi:hypothetical protein